MHRFHKQPYCRAAWGFGCASLFFLLPGVVAPTDVSAADQPTEFVEALRQRGWFDTAVEYLDFYAESYAENGRSLSDDFRNSLAYEKGRTLAAQAKQTARSRPRGDLQKRAGDLLLEFVKQHPDDVRAIGALQQASNLLTERALLAQAEFERLPQQARGQRERLQKNAQDLFDEALGVVGDLKQLGEQQLAALPKPTAAKRDPNTQKQLASLRAKLAEARFLTAKLEFDKSGIYPAGSEQFRQSLDKATEQFTQLARDYENNLVGFYGRLYEGRCYQALGDIKKALRSYGEIAFQPTGDPRFRPLVARAYRRRAECFRDGGNFDEAIRECRDWLGKSQTDELRRPEWLAVKFQLAMAYLDKHRSLSADNSNLDGEARRLLREVAQVAGEFQSQARTALASLASAASTRAGPADAAAANVKTFSEAISAGKSAMEQMNAAKLAARLARENNPDAVERLQQQAQAGKTDALRFFELAIRLADKESKPTELNSARYYLCWLYWEDGRIHEAAILGEFIARHYPENQFAPIAAKVAMAAYQRLYNQSRSDAGGDARYEADRLGSLAELIVLRWPKSSEAATATNLLINMAVRDNRLEEAEVLLRRLPESNRAIAQLNLGSALWTNYLQAAHSQSAIASENGAKRAQQDREQSLHRAEIFLRRGFDSSRSDSDISSAQIQGALYLAQLLLSQGNAREAIEVLEDRTAGPLTLLRKQSDATRQPGFDEETLKTALRAYVTVSPPQREQALATMDRLEQVVAANDGESGKKQLTRIYVSLGLQLQRQVQQLSEAGKSGEAKRVAAAFEDFLSRVSENGDSGDWAVRNWIAQTNLQLGIGLQGSSSQDSSSQDGEARRYFERAEQAYQAILDRAKEDSQFAPSPIALLGVQKHLADCQRGLGKYAEAMQQYANVLRKKPNLLELQRAAATTLQEWGLNEKNTGVIDKAIRGTMPQADQKNLVWGWLRLAAIANYATRQAEQGGDPQSPDTRQKIAKYHDLFFEARFNAAKARFIAAQISTGAEKKKHLRTARQSIQSMAQLYPELGGAKRKKAFEDLLQKVESESN